MIYKWTVEVFKEDGRIDYSKNVVAPIFIEERLNEELDTGEIILENMPISSKNAFQPKTKIRLTKLNGANDQIIDQYDMIVDHDDVQEYPQCPELCTHRISLIEASAIAQGMHVDNIALTYELKDVTLNYKTVTNIMSGNVNFSQTIVTSPTGAASWASQALVTEEGGFQKEAYFRYTAQYRWEGLESIQALSEEYIPTTAHTLKFTPPKLIMDVGVGSGFKPAIWLNYRLKVIEQKIVNNSVISSTEKINEIIGPSIKSNAILSLNEKVRTAFVNYGVSSNSIYQRTIKPYERSGTKLYLFSETPGALSLMTPFPGGKYSPTESSIIWGKTEYPIFTYNANAKYEEFQFTTSILTLDEISLGTYYKYIITCDIDKDDNFSPYTYYSAEAILTLEDYSAQNTEGIVKISESTTYKSIPISTSTQLYARTKTDEYSYNLFRKPPRKYNAYDFIRKALLTTEQKIVTQGTELSDINYLIEVSDAWINRLKQTTLYETTIQDKNLWQVLLIIGKYIHAIPYLEFGDNNNFNLLFRELGKAEEKEDKTTKLTVFNSRNLSEYFTQYDSYANNVFSSQNIVEEVISVKSTDGSYLVTNDNAEIVVSKSIKELLSVEMTQTFNSSDSWHDITKYVFEQSIYNLLSVENPENITPTKGDSLFYVQNTNVIKGLNFQRPTQNKDAPTALKIIYSKVYDIPATNLLYNTLAFRVRYKTQDALRVNVFRPDIGGYIKNSILEMYPHHEQFYGQQEKIVDSERFSLNLYGELIRVGNTIYQAQEYAPIGTEKNSGDLIKIDNEPYYITETQNEYYPDCVLQKITYSKNFNQLAQIVTIPSEPRFYEIATQNLINREIRLNDFFEIEAVKSPSLNLGNPLFLENTTWATKLKNILLQGDLEDLPNYAYTKYTSLGETALFPSSEINREDENNVIPKNYKTYSSCVVPLLHYPIKNGIVFEWDMADNFSAGDYVIDANVGTTVHDAYYSLQASRYVDAYGRAQFFYFELIKGVVDKDAIKSIPLGSVYEDGSMSVAEEPFAKVRNNGLVALDKDNRETLSFNYQINLLYSNNSGFVTYPNLFGNKNALKDNESDTVEIKVFVLSKRLNPLSDRIDDKIADIVVGEFDNIRQFLQDNTSIFPPFTENVVFYPRQEYIALEEDKTVADIESIIVCACVTNSSSSKTYYPLFGRNVGQLSNEDKFDLWEIHPKYN